ncbi:MAG: molybdenum cofactor biosynthesis protein, partial [Chloroflexi bacterium]|nr:molybdenum cofactor biosynthesis protein [Chloroflexota bacterium]
MKNFVSITLSDSRSDDPSITDKSGDVLISFLVSNNLNLYERILIPDDPSELESALEKYVNTDDVSLIVTTGGTGISQRDITPEITSKFLEKNIPGIPELI